MNQANVTRLVSELKIKVNRRRKLRNLLGPEGRLDKIRKTVTALFKHERLELNYNRADESRQYAERLISEAIRHGDTHVETMKLADFWLLEKQLVHKLFKVLAPRFQDYPVSYTRMYKAPTPRPEPSEIRHGYRRCVLELRGNPYPNLNPSTANNRNYIHNVLLDAAKADFRQQKYAEIAKNIGSGESQTTTQNVTNDPTTSS